MQDKKSYRIDESALRDKFTNYTISFNPACLELLENEVAHVKTHTSLEFPGTKKLVQFIVIPLVFIALGCAAFFAYNYIQDLPSASPVKDTVTITQPVVQPKVKEQPKPEIKPAVALTDTIKTEAPKRDTIIEAPTQKIKNVVKATPQQKIISKKDTGSITKINSAQVDTVTKKNKADTISTNKNRDTSAKKKKKKRKNSLDATDDIRQSAPNSADDDVVVPNN